MDIEIREEFKKVNKRLDGHDQRFDAVDARFDRVDARFDRVDARFDKVDAKFDAIDLKFDAIDVKFDAIDAKFDKVNTKFDAVDARIDDVGEQIHRQGVLNEERDRKADQTLELMQLMHQENRQFHKKMDMLDNHEHRISALESVVVKGRDPSL